MDKIASRNLVFISLVLFFLSLKINAQEEINPVIWSVEFNQEGDTSKIVAHASIESGWHVYSQIISDDPEAMGPIPLSFTLQPSESYQALGEPLEKSKMITRYDKAFEIDLNYYENELILEQPVKVVSKNDPIKGSISYMACDDERCIFPPEFTFELKINE